jgi:hypothetical protein
MGLKMVATKNPRIRRFQMKAKQLGNKLSLNKETVSNLSLDQMDEARGGSQVYPTRFIPLCNSNTFVCGNC